MSSLFIAGGEHHHGQTPGALIGSQAAQHFDPVHLRHFKSSRTTCGTPAGLRPAVRAGGRQIIQRLLAVARDHNLAVDGVLLKRPECQVDVVRIIFDQQDDAGCLIGDLLCEPPLRRRGFAPMARLLSRPAFPRPA